MRFFLDTEFIERGPDFPIEVMSVAIVTQTAEYYGVNTEFNPQHANEWVKENVIPYLHPQGVPLHLASRELIAQRIIAFVNANKGKTPIEFWGYYADYDWVVLCQLFGAMVGLPEGWPMYCRDLKQLCDELGNPKLPEKKEKEHNALFDARWNREAWWFLSEYSAHL